MPLMAASPVRRSWRRHAFLAGLALTLTVLIAYYVATKQLLTTSKGVPGYKADLKSVEELASFECNNRWPEAWFDELWTAYCLAKGHKAWAMTSACNYAWYTTDQLTLINAKTVSITKCGQKGFKCFVFDIEGSKCHGIKQQPVHPPVSLVHWGPPFDGAFVVGQGPKDCNPTHCRGGFNEDAVDFMMPKGTPVLAGRAGKVTKVFDGHGDGGPCWKTGEKHEANMVEVSHDDGTVDQYLHLEAGGIMVKKGDTVSKGDLLAHSGNSGCTSAPHLHVHTLNPAFTGTVPMQFTFPCENKVNDVAKRNTFFCNTPNCKCESAFCKPWPTSQWVEMWGKYCKSAKLHKGVWAMSRACGAVQYGFGPSAENIAVQGCSIHGPECSAWDKNGDKCD